jgi:hypothetical protein
VVRSFKQWCPVLCHDNISMFTHYVRYQMNN